MAVEEGVLEDEIRSAIEQRGGVLAGFRQRARRFEGRSNFLRRFGRRHRARGDGGEKGRDPVDEAVAESAELVRRHFERRGAVPQLFDPGGRGHAGLP